MADLDENYVPYAPISNVITVLRRIRDASLPDTLDNTSIQRIGISKGNAGRTVAAMKFLGAVDDGGGKTQVQERLARASTDEYPNVLAEVLRSAYSEIFKVVDPAEASDIQIHDAFRGFDPAKQRDRMVSLFVGLCQEANIIAGKPTIVRRRTTETSPKNQNNSNSKPPVSNKGDYSTPPLGETQTPPLTIPYEMIAVVFKKLPQNGQWTVGEKNLWLKGLEVALAMEIKVIEEDEVINQ